MTLLWRHPRACRLAVLLACWGWGSCVASSQEAAGVEIAPNVLVFATSNGNVVCSVGSAGALLVGTPSAESTPAISAELSERTSSATRYVVVWPQDSEHTDGDAGWGRRGAFVVMQEKALERLGGHSMGTPKPLPPRLITLGVDRPHVSFSDVIAFDMNGDSIHVVHQAPGYSDADALAHFHIANIVYLGQVFPGDGYPAIDASQGGTLDGLLRTLAAWGFPEFRVVPERGSVTAGTTVKAFSDMIKTVRDRIQQLIAAGAGESDIIRAHPTAPFDANWGHGRVPPDKFVHEVYVSLVAAKGGQIHR